MAYRIMHPTQAVDVYRPGSVTSEGGVPIPAVDTVVTTGLVVGVEDLTSEVRRGEDGRDVRIALRLWSNDITTVFKHGDVFKVNYQGDVHHLELEFINGPWGTGVQHDHREFDVFDRVES